MWTITCPGQTHKSWERDRNDQTQRRLLGVASGATAPDPDLEGGPRFRPKVVPMSLSSYILR